MTYIITHLAGWILEILKKESLEDNDEYGEKQDYYILYTLLLHRLVLKTKQPFHISAKHFEDRRSSALTISLYKYSAECHSKLPVNFKPYEDRPHSKTKCHSLQTKKSQDEEE